MFDWLEGIYSKFLQPTYQYLEGGFKYIFSEKWVRVSDAFYGHLRICLISIAIALLIALPLGVLISRSRWLVTSVISVLNVFYTIPSLAFLGLLVPIFGLSDITVIIVLVVYAQTILVRNIVIGFNSVDPSIMEAGRGMGMSKNQLFWRVELPLAAPIIVAGLRIATLATIAIATVGSFVGVGSLGTVLKDRNPGRSASGLVLVILMALAADILLRIVEQAVSGYRRKQNVKTKLKQPVAPAQVTAPSS